MPIIYQKIIKREDLLNNPDAYYVFGDNDMRVGTGGQAREMRGFPNAIGIRTKKSPTHLIKDYYTDLEYEENIKKIIEDFQIVECQLKIGNLVIFPLDGVGTGLAKLSQNAPKTLAFIEKTVLELFSKYGLLA